VAGVNVESNVAGRLRMIMDTGKKINTGLSVKVVIGLAMVVAMVMPTYAGKKLFLYAEEAPIADLPKQDRIDTTVREKDNVFQDYLAAAGLFQEVDIKLDKEKFSILSWKGEGEAITVSNALRGYIKQSEAVTDIVRKGIARNNCVVPEVTSAADSLSYLAKFRALGRLMVMEGRINEIDGNYEKAYQNYLDTMRFGNDIARGSGLIYGLVNVAIDNMAIQVIRPGLKRADAKTLEMVVNGLKEIESNLVPYSEILKNEFKYMRQHMQQQHMQLNNEFSRRVIQYADKAIDKDEERDFWKNIPKDTMSESLIPSLSRAKTNYLLLRTQLRGTRLRAAAELYQRRKNKLPDNLGELYSLV
jgi:tetrahydromethanopterin S-methyltransferase subunit G